MSALMQGFLIAIWVVLTLIYVRLGIISDELKGEKKINKSCSTCIFSELSGVEEPCSNCFLNPDKPLWKGLDE